MDETPETTRTVTAYISGYAFGPGCDESHTRAFLATCHAGRLDVVGDPTAFDKDGGWAFTCALTESIDRTVRKLLENTPHTVFTDFFVSVEIGGKVENLVRINDDVARGRVIDGRVIK